jgi:hypothetical protein
MLKKFLEYYFNESMNYSELDKIIEDFKSVKRYVEQLELVNELSKIIETKNYISASKFIKKYGNRVLSEEKTEKLISYLYDKFLNNPTKIKATDFEKKHRIIFCPICNPNPQVATRFSLINKATLMDKDLQIYICKPCKLVWLDENDIRVENAQDYKKFMKANGFKGLWKELKDVDVL